MPKHRAIEASIEVDGKQLEEYGGAVDAENERAYNCFVASESGKAFKICIKHERSPNYDLKIETHVDGLLACASSSRSGKRLIEGFDVGVNAIRQFVFTNITLTDDDDALPSSDCLGTIELRISRIVFVGPLLPQTTFSGPSSLPDDGPLQEKSKKLGGHKIGAGKTIYMTMTVQSTRQYDPRDTKPYVVFRFMYRPIGILRAQKIVPHLMPSAAAQPEPNSLPTRTGRGKQRENSEASASDVTHKGNKHGVSSSSSRASTLQTPRRAKREIPEVDVEDDEEMARLDSQMEELRKKKEKLGRKRVKRESSVEVLPEYELDENGAIDLTAD